MCPVVKKYWLPWPGKRVLSLIPGQGGTFCICTLTPCPHEFPAGAAVLSTVLFFFSGNTFFSLEQSQGFSFKKSCPPSSLSFCIAWIGPSALSLSLSQNDWPPTRGALFFFFYPPTPAQSNPTLYLRHAKLSPFSSARLLLQPPYEVHVLSESLLPPSPPPHLLPLSLPPPPPPTTTFPLSLLQFSHVQSYKPAGPWRRADDTAKRAQLVLRNCELDSYVQPHIYLSSVYLFIFYIFVKTLQWGWGGSDGPDLTQLCLQLRGRRAPDIMRLVVSVACYFSGLRLDVGFGLRSDAAMQTS